jgi:hypothetical protein
MRNVVLGSLIVHFLMKVLPNIFTHVVSLVHLLIKAGKNATH